jgi:hypothetical protein
MANRAVCALAMLLFVCVAAPRGAHADLCGSIPGNLVANCGFETGDFTDWTLSGNEGFTGVTGLFGSTPPNSGNYQAYFGAVGSDTMVTQQPLSTIAGEDYSVTFYLANLGGTPNDFSAYLGGMLLTSFINASPFGYTEYTFTDVVPGANAGITFDLRQDPSYFLLDDISVVATGNFAVTPEPSSLMLIGLGLLMVVAIVGTRKSWFVCGGLGA